MGELYRIFVFVIAFSAYKVIRRDAHFFSGKEIEQIVVQQIDVERFKAFIIVIAVFVFRIFFAADIIAVETEYVRQVADRLEFEREFFCGRRFA